MSLYYYSYHKIQKDEQCNARSPKFSYLVCIVPSSLSIMESNYLLSVFRTALADKAAALAIVLPTLDYHTLDRNILEEYVKQH